MEVVRFTFWPLYTLAKSSKVVRFTFWPLYTLAKSSKAGWGTDPFWTVWRYLVSFPVLNP
jgi:hypothetical protein